MLLFDSFHFCIVCLLIFVVRFVGVALRSFEGVYWRVMVWDGEFTACMWSDVAYWEMAILDDSDWYV